MHSADVLARFPDARQAGAGWKARCPAHDDQRPSLSINIGDDGKILLRCFAGCTFAAILASVGLEERDTFPEQTRTTPTPRPIAATYRYCDEGGLHLYDVVRYLPKDFRQRRADREWTMTGVRRVLYRLPDLQGQTTVYVVEGEKDVDRLRALGLPATCNVGGAGKWRPEYVAQLQAAGVERVVVLPDNDDPGRQHSAVIAASCHAAGLVVKVVALPDLPLKGDVSDWIAAGHTREDLVARVTQTDRYTPPVTAPPVGGRTPRTEAPRRAETPSWRWLANVEPEQVQWLWPKRLTYGTLTIWMGDGGLGKSRASNDIAARITTGAAWPDDGIAPRGTVIILSAEDSASYTIRPAIEAAHGDPSRVAILDAVTDAHGRDRTFNLATDLAALDALLDATHAKLIIIDPLSAYFGTALDSYRDTDVRSVLEPVTKLAERRHVAVLGIMHVGKGTDRQARHRALGSVAFVNAARLVFAVGPHPDDERRRILAPVKANLCREAAALAFRLEDAGGVAKVVWEDGAVLDVTADAVLAGKPQTQPEDQQDATSVIRTLLDDEDWPLVAKLALDAGRAHGISERTMRRAASRLGIEIRKIGFRGGWRWHRPAEGDTPAADAAPTDSTTDATPKGTAEGDEAAIVKTLSPSAFVSPSDATKGTASPCAPSQKYQPNTRSGEGDSGVSTRARETAPEEVGEIA